MGASSSKAARQAVQAATNSRPSWAGATTESIKAAARARPTTVGRASATKDDFIKRDSQDPQLLEQLNKIGPVSVNAHNMPFQTAQSARIAKIFQSRQATEEAANEPQRNRLEAAALADMLNDRKSAKTDSDLVRIAKEFDVDVDLLTQLAQYVNAPSVNPVHIPGKQDEGETGRTVLRAYWSRALIDAPLEKQ